MGRVAIRLGERVLDFVPGAYTIHGWLERTRSPAFRAALGTSVLQSKINRWRFFWRSVGRSLSGARALDIGTGWSGHDLIMLRLMGCDEITTMDKARHLDLECVRATVDGFRHQATMLARELQDDTIPGRISSIRTDNTEVFLDSIGVRYRIADTVEALGMPDQTLDLVFSHSVLQLIPRRKLRQLLCETSRLLKPGGHSFHDVRFIDNNYRGGTDEAPFAHYAAADWLWNVCQSRKFNYHNRVTHAELLTFAEKCGFELLSEETVRWDQELASTKLAARFQSMDRSDLAVGNATMIHEKPLRPTKSAAAFR